MLDVSLFTLISLVFIDEWVLPAPVPPPEPLVPYEALGDGVQEHLVVRRDPNLRATQGNNIGDKLAGEVHVDLERVRLPGECALERAKVDHSAVLKSYPTK